MVGGAVGARSAEEVASVSTGGGAVSARNVEQVRHVQRYPRKLQQEQNPRNKLLKQGREKQLPPPLRKNGNTQGTDGSLSKCCVCSVVGKKCLEW